MNSLAFQRVPVTCPNCKTRFTAPVLPIIDVGQHPEARALLLSGQLNVAVCPNCGHGGLLSAPLVYHDPDKELLLTYMPHELNMSELEQQRIVGDLTNRLINSLPAEQRKGYLLRPKNYLTMDALIKDVLQAEGITPEMMAAQQARAALLERLMRALDPKVREATARANDEQIDVEFMDLLALNIEAAQQAQQMAAAGELLALREQLLQWTTLGREIAASEDAIRSLGNEITREGLLDRLVEAALKDEAVKVDTLISVGRPAIDYVFFQMLTERITTAQQAGDRATADKLNELRQTILEITAEMDAQARAVTEKAGELLREALDAADPEAFVRANQRRIDNLFLSVLEANLEAAERTGQEELAARLQAVSDAVMNVILDSQPPEIQIINHLMSAEYPAGTREMLEQNRDLLSPRFVEFIGRVAHDLAQGGRSEAAARLEQIRDQVQGMIAGR